jgi:hypothetical protein
MSGEVVFATGHVSGRREADVHLSVHLSGDRPLVYVVLVPPSLASRICLQFKGMAHGDRLHAKQSSCTFPRESTSQNCLRRPVVEHARSGLTTLC